MINIKEFLSESHIQYLLDKGDLYEVYWEFTKRNNGDLVSATRLTNFFINHDIPYMQYLSEIPPSSHVGLGQFDIVIPKNITLVGVRAFIKSALKKVTFEEGTVLLNYHCFAKCELLETVRLPNTLKEIRDGAFYGCTSLKKIVIPDSVTTLGRDIFQGCSSMQEIVFKGKKFNVNEWK